MQERLPVRVVYLHKIIETHYEGEYQLLGVAGALLAG